jgi:hypothetical protein
MTGADWAVLVGGIASIAWVNWYFLVASRGEETSKQRPASSPRVDDS